MQAPATADRGERRSRARSPAESGSCEKTVSEDRVIDPMWSVQGSDALQRLQSGIAEIDGDVGQMSNPIWTQTAQDPRTDVWSPTDAVDTDRSVPESAPGR